MRRDFVTTMRRVLDRRKRDEADLRVSTVVGRDTDGTTLYRPQDGECELRGGISADRSGSIVLNPSAAAFGRRGAAGVAGVGARGQFGAAWVESLDPATFAQGWSGDVTVTGRGFRPGMTFEFLLPSSVSVHPGITIVTTTYVSPTEYTLSITVAEDANVVAEAPLAFDTPRRIP